MLDCDQPCQLLQDTVDLLKADKRDLPQIYVATGVPYYWLRGLYYGQIKHPSVNRITYLFEKLTEYQQGR